MSDEPGAARNIGCGCNRKSRRLLISGSTATSQIHTVYTGVSGGQLADAARARMATEWARAARRGRDVLGPADAVPPTQGAGSSAGPDTSRAPVPKRSTRGSGLPADGGLADELVGLGGELRPVLGVRDPHPGALRLAPAGGDRGGDLASTRSAARSSGRSMASSVPSR